MKTKSLFIFTIIFFVASFALAQDVNPPVWRGTNESTLQHWQFIDGSNPATPEDVNNPYGIPTCDIGGVGMTHVKVPGPDGTEVDAWRFDDGGFPGAGSGQLMIDPLMNEPVTNDKKVVRVQVTSTKPPFAFVDSGMGFITKLVKTNTTDSANGWKTYSIDYQIRPNPPQEMVGILFEGFTGTVLVEQVVIDTWCFSDKKDYYPPEWRTNTNGDTTSQGWDFESTNSTSNPNFGSNKYSTAKVKVTGGSHTNRLAPGDEGLWGGWYFPETNQSIVFSISNSPIDRAEKRLRVQVISTMSVSKDEIITDPPSSNTFVSPDYHLGSSPWHLYYFDYKMEPNPNFETVTIKPKKNNIIHEVVIDTWCLPEPFLFINCYFLFFIYYFKKRK